MNRYEFNVNGFLTEAFYDNETVESIFIPLLKKWTKLYKTKGSSVIIFMSAPPGAGKTTLAMLIEHLSKKIDSVEEIKAVGLDGFHYPQQHILSHSVNIASKSIPMKDVKGCPETFDTDKLFVKIQQLKTHNTTWPIYDRKIHDVIDDAIFVDKNIVLIEGNWLLSNEHPWHCLLPYCDYSIFVSATPDFLKTRLIERKIKGGASKEEAEAFYFKSDIKNIDRIMKNHSIPDLELALSNTGYKIITSPSEK